MPRKRKPFRLLGFLGSLLVAIVVAGVTFTLLSSPTKPAIPTTPAATSTNQTSTSSATTTVLLFGVPMPSAASDQLYRVALPNGQPELQTVPSGWRLDQLGQPNLSFTAGKSDEGLTLVGPGGWHVPLRMRSGVPYAIPSVLGMFDPAHAAISAAGNSGTLVLSVSRVGDIRPLVTVPDNANVLGISGGAVWFSTFQPGEGIESAPQGPSTLVRASSDGTLATEATDTRVIVSAVARPNGTLAYGFDTGEFTVRPSGWQGQGLPLLWLDAKTIIFARGANVMELNLDDQTAKALFSLPAEPERAVLSPDGTSP